MMFDVFPLRVESDTPCRACCRTATRDPCIFSHLASRRESLTVERLFSASHVAFTRSSSQEKRLTRCRRGRRRRRGIVCRWSLRVALTFVTAMFLITHPWIDFFVLRHASRSVVSGRRESSRLAGIRTRFRRRGRNILDKAVGWRGTQFRFKGELRRAIAMDAIGGVRVVDDQIDVGVGTCRHIHVIVKLLLLRVSLSFPWYGLQLMFGLDHVCEFFFQKVNASRRANRWESYWRWIVIIIERTIKSSTNQSSLVIEIIVI